MWILLWIFSSNSCIWDLDGWRQRVADCRVRLMETLLGRNLLLVFNPHEIGREGTVFICKPLPGILSKRDGGDEMYCGVFGSLSE